MADNYTAQNPDGDYPEDIDEKVEEAKVKVETEHGSRYGAMDVGFGLAEDDLYEGADGMDLGAYGAQKVLMERSFDFPILFFTFVFAFDFFRKISM